MKKLEEVLSQDIIDQIIEEGFPIKIQIPMSLSLRGNVYIKRFERIDQNDSLYHKQIFTIPE